MQEKWWDRLAAEIGCEVKTHEPLAGYTSFQIGGEAEALFTVSSGDALCRLTKVLFENGVPVHFLGNGTNLLVSDAGVKGATVRFSPCGDVRVEGERLFCPAGVPLKRVCRLARDYALSGLEFAFGIPGTVGGGVYMNAGAYGGDMAGVVESVTVLTENGLQTLSAELLALSYRHSALMENGGIVTDAVLKLQKGDPAGIGAAMEDYMHRRREKQPLEFPSAGSYFKRPEGHFAGQLIEQSGLKGFTVGGAAVSEKHAGFVINRDHATCYDVLVLEDAVRQKVLADSGVLLKREVRYWGEGE